MLDILFLALTAYLIARVIWNIFSVFQQFLSFIRFAYSPRTKIKTQLPPQKFESQKVFKKTGIDLVQKVENKKKQLNLENVLRDQSKIRQQAMESTKNETKLEQKQSLKLQETTKTVNLKAQDLFPDRLEQDQVSSNLKNMQEHEKTIKSLKEQIAAYKREKQHYIHKIEQIVQHVINQTESAEENINAHEDDQLSAINNLKHELNTSQQKIHEQRELLARSFQKEKVQLIKQHQEVVKNLTNDIKIKTTKYEATINQVTQRIQQLERKIGNSQAENIRQNNDLEQRKQPDHWKITSLSKQLQEIKQEKHRQSHNSQVLLKSLKQQLQKSKTEIKRLREDLAKSQNDYTEHQTKNEAQINSFRKQNHELNELLQKQQCKLLQIQQQTRQLRSKLQNQQHTGQNVSRQLTSLESKLAEQARKNQQIQNKFSQTYEQLKFCQQQLKSLKDSESELRDRLEKASQSPKRSDRSAKKQDIENSPQYIRLKMELQRLKRKLGQKQENVSRAKTPVSSNIHQRQLQRMSPLQAATTPKKLSPSSLSQNQKVSPYQRQTYTKSPHIAVSTILVDEDRRSTTPLEKKFAASTINEGGAYGQVYLGETQILSEAQRNFIVHEVSAVKKITVKKTRLMYSLRQKGNKPIHEFILGAPNIILVAELQNHKIVGAFSQNAFSKENKFTKSSIVSKAMIFDVTRQVFITNEGQGESIRYQENALIWGNKEFVVYCQEPITISVNLNCQGSVYFSNYSSAQFLDSEEGKMKVLKLQIHRVFLG